MRMGCLFRCADINRIAEDVRRMNSEVDCNGTVTTELIVHRIRVVTGYVERVDVGSILRSSRFTPYVSPFVRQLTIGHGCTLRCDDDAVAYIEIEMDDTVTTIEGYKRIGVVSCIFEVALYRYVVLILKIVLVELYRITVTNGVLDGYFILLFIVNNQVVEVIVELVG